MKFYEALKVYSKKDLTSSSFATNFAKAYKDKFIDFISTKGNFFKEMSRDDVLNDVPTTITSKGLFGTRKLVHQFISTKLSMGDNIATQSVDNLSKDEDWYVVANNILKAIKFKTAGDFEKTSFKPFSDQWKS